MTETSSSVGSQNSTLVSLDSDIICPEAVEHAFVAKSAFNLNLLSSVAVKLREVSQNTKGKRKCKRCGRTEGVRRKPQEEPGSFSRKPDGTYYAQCDRCVIYGRMKRNLREKAKS